MAPLASTSHVTSWKKLGLELKIAKEKPTPKAAAVQEQPAVTTPTSNKKRSISEDNEGATAKKQRLENGTSGKSEDLKTQSSKKKKKDGNRRKSDEPQSIEAASPALTPDDQQKQKLKKPRKSVSFAADAKSSDGHDEPEHDPDDVVPVTVTPEKRRAEKREKREQRSKDRSRKTEAKEYSSTPSDPILTYLSVYHTARSQWKFQKNRETVLLKHTLSVDRIPPSYNPAVASYLSGLKSDGARNRVADSAKGAIEAEEGELEKVEGQETEKGRYESEIRSFKEKLTQTDMGLKKGNEDGDAEDSSDLDATWRKRLEKRKRAELVYFLMRGRDSTEDLPKATTNVKRKRKTRTAAVEDSSSSSSSESESDSDSDSDSDDSDTSTSNTELRKPTHEKQNDTSSSSSLAHSSTES